MTQSSMHLPPLRQGRRARHTEAADTGRAGPSAWPRGPLSGEALRGLLLLGLRYLEDRPPAGLSSWGPPSAGARPPKPAMNEHTWAGAGASQGFRPPVTRRAREERAGVQGGRERGALPEGPSGPEHHQGCGCL